MSTALYQLVTIAQACTPFNRCCQYSSQKSLTTLSCWNTDTCWWSGECFCLTTAIAHLFSTVTAWKSHDIGEP